MRDKKNDFYIEEIKTDSGKDKFYESDKKPQQYIAQDEEKQINEVLKDNNNKVQDEEKQINEVLKDSNNKVQDEEKQINEVLKDNNNKVQDEEKQINEVLKDSNNKVQDDNDKAQDDNDEVQDNNKDKKQEEYEKISIVKEVSDWIKISLYSLVYALFLALIVFTHTSVPTGSMSDTIKVGDKLIGFRFAYLFSKPKRYDVIIFRYPDDEETLVVKRIIGLPNERVTIKSGKIYINDSDVPLNDSFILEEPNVLRNTGTYQVPEDGYFIVGDHRNDSLDSRYWDNTFLREDKILSKVFFTYYPKLKIFLFENEKYEKYPEFFNENEI